MRAARASGWAVLLLAALATGCASSRPEEQWQASSIDAASERVLWQVTTIALEKEGFPVGTGLDPSTFVATSGWRLDLAPFKGAGYRERAQVRYERAQPGKYRVFVRVAVETNEDITKPMDPRYAKWKPASDDRERALVLIQRIRSWMGAELELASPGR